MQRHCGMIGDGTRAKLKTAIASTTGELSEMMDAQQLRGMTIVSLSEATRIGAIDDVLFATQPLRVGALQATGEGTQFIVPFEQVRNLGTDAVTVESSQVTQIAGTGSSLGDLLGLAVLQKLKVVDEAGTLLGVVQTVEIDPATGSVSALVAHKGGVLGVGGASTRIDALAIRSVGSEVITITDAGAGRVDG